MAWYICSKQPPISLFVQQFPFTVGRSTTPKANFLSIDNPSVGFQHFAMRIVDLSMTLVNLSRKNPIRVNGEIVATSMTLETDKGKAEIKVGGIYEQYIYNYAFITPACYQRLFGTAPHYNIYQVRLTDKSEETGEAFSAAMLEDSRVVAVSFMDQNVDDFRKMLNSLDMVVVVMVVCAGALALVVLYNLTNINLAERQREIATFKVLGFFNRETARFIYIENIILTLLGIAVGLWLGVLLTGFIIRTVEVDNVMFGRDIYPSTFLYAAGMTLLFSLLVNAATGFKIKAVNMVESLKSVE